MSKKWVLGITWSISKKSIRNFLTRSIYSSTGARSQISSTITSRRAKVQWGALARGQRLPFGKKRRNIKAQKVGEQDIAKGQKGTATYRM